MFLKYEREEEEGLCAFSANWAFSRFIKPFFHMCNWTLLIYIKEGRGKRPKISPKGEIHFSFYVK